MEKEEDVVVVTEVHPDEEEIARQVNEMFAEKRIRGVRLVTRPVPRHARSQRGLIPGSNTAFRQGNPDGDLDEQFVWEITKAAQHARVVLDVHGNKSGDYPFYGELARHNRLIMGIASLICSSGALVHPAPHLAASLPNYVGWDLTPETDVEALRPILEKLGAGWCPPAKPMTEYRLVRTVSAVDGAAHGFREEYEQFEPLPPKLVAQLGLPSGSCVVDWSASLYKTDIWGDVIVPLPKGAH
jgi:hypothetical protein